MWLIASRTRLLRYKVDNNFVPFWRLIKECGEKKQNRIACFTNYRPKPIDFACTWNELEKSSRGESIRDQGERSN